MKAVLILLVVTYSASTVVDACSDVYNFSTPVQRLSNFSCAAGDTPLGFQCIEMTYPEFTTDINKYPCFTVNNVSGRHIEVLIEPVNPIAQVRTCIREDGFSEQCGNGINTYCKRVQSQHDSTIIRIFCLTGGCETTALSLWVKIDRSSSDVDEENWCLTRSQNTPSSLNNVIQPVNQMFDFDQDGTELDFGGFDVLQPLPVTTLFLIVMIIKLMF